MPARAMGHDRRFPGHARTLIEELEANVSGEVRFDDGTRAVYATDGSNYRQVPIGVVIPHTVDDVVATVAACSDHGVPILSRGAGTSLAGQCCNVAVIIDWSKYIHAVVALDPDARRAVAQPGIVRDALDRKAQKHGLTFAPDTSTHAYATLGGMIGNNSCGVHSLMAGKTEENTEELEVLTYRGLRIRVGRTSEEELERITSGGGPRTEIYSKLRDLRDRYADLIRERYPRIPRRVSGYNLEQLLPENGFHVARALVGTESTCVTVLEATVRLVPSPPARSLLVLAYPSVGEAGDDVPEVLESGPIGLEGIDEVLVDNMKRKRIHPEDIELVPPGKGWLLVEFGGEDKRDSDDQARRLMKALDKRKHPPGMKLYDDPPVEKKIWEVRESGLGATARVPGQPDTWEGWEDAAVPPEKLGRYLRDFRTLLDRYGFGCALYGHFGQGCVHTRIDFDVRSTPGIATYRSFVEEAADLVVSFGGSLSGEHGDGQSRAELLPRMFGPELVQAFAEFKAIWDPDGMMNPGKVVRPHRIDEDLRYGAAYAPARPRTVFTYPQDDWSFARAAERCVGVGKCRRHEGGVMCPSYMVTLEEKDSTRGRAHLLWEMLNGDPVEEGWRSEAVKEALDLCLACKGCKKECPISVDMATYKAEFLSHYYRGRVRPRAAYAMGLIYWWARLASRAPRLANAAARAPVLSRWMKRAGGVAQDRAVPVFAERTFKGWMASRGPHDPHVGRKVIVWPDTFTNHFHPEAGQAAVEVLEAAGFEPVVPKAALCCGRPLYDYGMLRLARRLLRQVLEELRPAIRAGIPLVGVEPSCLAVFKDELLNLFPHDEDARRLSHQSWVLSDFLLNEGWEPPQLPGVKAVVQPHCHHQSVMGFEGDRKMLDLLRLDYEIPDSGCCGMAGSFGFEAERYSVSIACGERVLLPKVREAADALVVADGFSCRTQIEQGAGRKALHLAQVLKMAVDRSRPA
jgi:FAD/FMN-containing dehydrogenase/Fe-S oxidoreductase